MKRAVFSLLPLSFTFFFVACEINTPHPTKYARIDCWGITTLAGQPEVKTKLLTANFAISDGAPYPTLEYLTSIHRTTFDKFQVECNKRRYAKTPIPNTKLPWDPNKNYKIEWETDRHTNYATLGFAKFKPGSCGWADSPCESHNDCCNHTCDLTFKSCVKLATDPTNPPTGSSPQ